MQQTYSILIRFNINTDVTILLSGQNGTSSEEWKGIFFCVLFRICVSFCFLSSAVRFSFVLVVWPLVFIYILLLQCSIQLFTLPFNWHTPLLLFFCFFFLFCFKSLVTFSLSNILTATDNSISNKNGEKKKEEVHEVIVQQPIDRSIFIGFPILSVSLVPSYNRCFTYCLVLLCVALLSQAQFWCDDVEELYVHYVGNLHFT